MVYGKRVLEPEWEHTEDDDQPLSKLIRKDDFIRIDGDEKSDDFGSSNNVPLATKIHPESTISPAEISVDFQTIMFDAASTVSPEELFKYIDVSDVDDPDYVQTCEYRRCKKEVFSSSFRCSAFLCWDHFQDDQATCNMHQNHSTDNESNVVNIKNKLCEVDAEKKKPESYCVDWAPKEVVNVKVIGENKRKLAKTLRKSGKEYFSLYTKTVVPQKSIGPKCDSSWCKKGER